MPRLIIKNNGDATGQESFDLKLGVNRLGRTSDNDLQIDRATVSTFHCEIVWLNDAVDIRDQNSTNGTFIDGEKITEGRLEPGQVLRVGDVELFLDTAKASISVPNLNQDPVRESGTPPPGTLPCENHAGTAAAYHCPHCQKNLCDSCVRTLKLLKGHVHKLCPFCSTHCNPITYRPKRKRRSILQVVQNTFGFLDKGSTQKIDN